MSAEWKFRLAGLLCSGAAGFFGVSVIRTPIGFILAFAAGGLLTMASERRNGRI